MIKDVCKSWLKFFGYCAIVCIFSHITAIKIYHGADWGTVFRVSLEGYGTSNVRVKLERGVEEKPDNFWAHLKLQQQQNGWE